MLKYPQDIKNLIDKLNYYTKKYDEGHPEISDLEWDKMYFKLVNLENKYHYYCKDSPTQIVNYQVINNLKKVEHNHKMLSLDKTKSINDVINFSNKQILAAMSKVDGLTCSLRYIGGKLISAETRGDGTVGEDILHNALVIPSIPNRIDYTDELIIDGEIVCLYSDFVNFENEYKNPRNFAAGSIRLLDAKECASRKLTFIIWDVIKGFDECNSFTAKMLNAQDLGFFIVPMASINPDSLDEKIINYIKESSKKISIPIDGVVFKYEDIRYGQKQGKTAHHFKNAIAYKFYDETYDTKLKDIEWSMGRTGELTPVAKFEPVEINETTVQRANLHNLSIMEDILGIPFKNQSIQVFKANMIIPQIYNAEKPKEKPENIIQLPKNCPICGKPVKIKENNDVKELYCENNSCPGKFINQLNHFCGKKGLDIKGLSLATLKKLVNWGWVKNIKDIYHLKNYKDEWTKKSGFGKKSVNNILNSIEESRECSLESFISAIGIPLIGSNVSKELTKYFTTYEAFREAIIDKYDFSLLDGFAEVKSNALLTFDYSEADQIEATELTIKKIEKSVQLEKLPLEGKKYVITGTVKQFKNRTELQKFIEDRGGKVVSSISKNVNYLINNNSNSTSAKSVTAKKMGIPIITEAEFLEELS